MAYMLFLSKRTRQGTEWTGIRHLPSSWLGLSLPELRIVSGGEGRAGVKVCIGPVRTSQTAGTGKEKSRGSGRGKAPEGTWLDD